MSVILTVKQLNMYVRSMLENDKYLRQITVVGEISGFKLYNSGHAYFTLKDSESAISAVMFNMEASGLKFMPKDGMKVLITGRVSIFEKSGQYQLYASKMLPDGIGAEFLAYEQLKEKLEKEGLFDASSKKPIPRYPKKIGVISSLNGAAIHDFCVTVQNRYPFADILIHGAAVQGEECPKSVVKAIEKFKNIDIDVLVITRGGGSFEDLSGFNDEKLARVVYDLNVPVVSAIGHETDFTILDFVADLRAATPTAAAQAVTPGREELYITVQSLSMGCKNLVLNKLEHECLKIDDLKNRIKLQSDFTKKYDDIKILKDRISSIFSNKLAENYYYLDKTVLAINALSPLAILSRGYSLVYKGENVIRTINDVKKEDNIKIRLKDGEIFCHVTDKTDLRTGSEKA
ncbi:MAG: exodeoxyribonuclease VII large subunit [Clostridiales bacterium]|nr:MAG: exodeoxyribonuclease VII large subunit [Clostridiales bacterium]